LYILLVRFNLQFCNLQLTYLLPSSFTLAQPELKREIPSSVLTGSETPVSLDRAGKS